MESFWQLQQVQALVHLFVGSTAAALKEEDLDELALSDWPDNHDIPTADIQFRPPISIISHHMSDSPANPFVEDACTSFTPQVASYEKTVRPPDTDPDPADQNNWLPKSYAHLSLNMVTKILFTRKKWQS